MHTLSRLRARGGFGRLLLFCLSLTACTSWKVQTVPTQEATSDPRYAGKTVRLTTLDNEQIKFTRLEVRGDSIAGLRGGVPFTMALADVGEIATLHDNAGGTLGLVFGSAAIAGAAILIALAAQHDGS